MKKLKKVKINKAKIYSIFSIVLVSLMLISTFGGNSVYAELNPNATGLEGAASVLNKIVSSLEGLVSAGLSGVAVLINSLAVIIFFSLNAIFSGATGSVFPSPDNIVFNRVAIFDVNFFNPNKKSIYATASAGNVILKLYNSFQSIAVSVFILAAVIVGIKLALSTLASEKAACKKAMLNWLVGIVVLFLMRLIIAAIFELNELIVWKISLIADDVEFSINIFESIPLVGNVLSNVVNGLASLITGKSDIRVGDLGSIHGYTGLITKFMLKGYGGDFVSSIVTFVIIGQMLTLMVVYGKRLVYTMILGIMAPLIVVFDTIGKILKGSSNVLSNWFREFATLVFSQSLHAMVVAVSLIIIKEFNSNADAQGLLGIVAIIMISSLIKFDKLIKQMFGLSDGMLGSMKNAGQSVRHAMMGAKAGISSIVDNKKKLDTAKKGVADAEKKRASIISQRGEVHFNAASSNILSAADASSKPEDKRRFIEEFDKHMASAEKDGYEISAEQKKALLEKRDEIVKGLEGNTVVNNNNGNTEVNIQGNSTVNNSGGRTETRLSGGQTRLANLSGNDFAREFMRPGTIEGAKLERELRSGSGKTNIRMPSEEAAFAGNTENINTQTSTTSSNFSTNNSNTSSSSSGAVDKHKEDQLLKDMKTIIKEIKNSKKSESSLKSINSQIADADKEIANAKKAQGSASFASIMGPANTVMGGAIGLGMGEDLADAIGKGGLATAAFDAAAEKIGKNERVGGTSIKVIESMEDMKSKLLGEMSKTTRRAAKAMDRTANMNNL